MIREDKAEADQKKNGSHRTIKAWFGKTRQRLTTSHYATVAHGKAKVGGHGEWVHTGHWRHEAGVLAKDGLSMGYDESSVLQKTCNMMMMMWCATTWDWSQTTIWVSKLANHNVISNNVAISNNSLWYVGWVEESSTDKWQRQLM